MRAPLIHIAMCLIKHEIYKYHYNTKTISSIKGGADKTTNCK